MNATQSVAKVRYVNPRSLDLTANSREDRT